MEGEREDKERELQAEWMASVKAQRHKNKTSNEMKKILYIWKKKAWEESLRGSQRNGHEPDLMEGPP